MNKLQNDIACRALDLLNENNGHLSESTLLSLLENEFGMNNTREIWFVIIRLTNDYKLIYKSNSWLCLSSNGEVAANIGVNKYIQKLHTNARLDIKMKQLEVVSKWLSILKDSRVLLTVLISSITMGLIYALLLVLKVIL